MIKAIADRLAEAFAEYLHEKVRKVYWGMRPMRTSAMRNLFARITRIRPAPGYPACPEHTEKGTIWQLLDVEAHTGMKLTESFAMWPGHRFPAGISAIRTASTSPWRRSSATVSKTTRGVKDDPGGSRALVSP